jgi:hypothetical protein
VGPLGLRPPPPIAAGKRQGELPAWSVRWLPEDGIRWYATSKHLLDGSASLIIRVLTLYKGWTGTLTYNLQSSHDWLMGTVRHKQAIESTLEERPSANVGSRTRTGGIRLASGRISVRLLWGVSPSSSTVGVRWRSLGRCWGSGQISAVAKRETGSMQSRARASAERERRSLDYQEHLIG